MRADNFFAERFGSRTKAKYALQQGLVLRNGRPLSPSDDVSAGDAITFVQRDGYVSRGGDKLARGLMHFRQSVAGEVFADLGASTGGFCDVLLQNGAARVYAVDVGCNQLAETLRANRAIIPMDGVNARYLTRENFPEQLDGVVSDLSFISLRLVLPVIAGLLEQGGRAFVLFKPQFECGGAGLGKNGILPVSYHHGLLSAFYEACVAHDMAPVDIVNAPIRPKKNVEYVLFLKKGTVPIPQEEFLRRAALLW